MYFTLHLSPAGSGAESEEESSRAEQYRPSDRFHLLKAYAGEGVNFVAAKDH